MSGPQPYRSRSRWTVLQVLADATEPLDRKELAARSGLATNNVRDTLIRPRRARWVSTSPVVIVTSLGRCEKLVYTITDLGREVLAEHLKESRHE